MSLSIKVLHKIDSKIISDLEEIRFINLTTIPCILLSFHILVPWDNIMSNTSNIIFFTNNGIRQVQIIFILILFSNCYCIR